MVYDFTRTILHLLPLEVYKDGRNLNSTLAVPCLLGIYTTKWVITGKSGAGRFLQGMQGVCHHLVLGLGRFDENEFFNALFINGSL